MKIQHNLNQHNLPQQHQTAQNILRDLIISRGITVIEHDILFGGICFKDEPYLAIFWYKQKEKGQSPENVFWLVNLIEFS